MTVILHSLGRPRADTVETSTESHLSKLPAKYFRGDGPKFSLVNWIFVIAYRVFETIALTFCLGAEEITP